MRGKALLLVFLLLGGLSYGAPEIVLVKETLNETADVFGDFKLLGEVENRGDQPAIYVKITLILKDKDGRVIGTPFSYVKGSNLKYGRYFKLQTDTCLQPGEKGFFEIYTDVKKEKVAEWDYKITWDVPEEPKPFESEVVLIEESLNETTDFLGDLKVLGEVKNTGDIPVAFVEVTVICRGRDGKILDIAESFIDGSKIKLEIVETDTGLFPGEVGTFEIDTLVKKELVAACEYRLTWREVEWGEVDVKPAGKLITTWGKLKLR